MPKQSKKSDLVSALGVAGIKAFDAHKANDVQYGAGADLPAGIEGGIAELVDCKFDKYKSGDNVGKYYFYAAGVVHQPKEVGGVPVEGLRTSIIEPICNTPNRSRETISDHLAWVINELQKLGVETASLDLGGLEEAAGILKAEQPYFRFRTWQGQATEQFPNPRVNHDWRGVCEYSPDGAIAVVDSTADAVEEEPEEEEAEIPDAIDLLATAAKADNGDSDAEAQMVEAAEAAGVDHTEYETWEEVANVIVEQSEAGEEDKEKDEEGEEYEEEAPWQPEKGEYYYYKPPRAKKRIECEITAVLIGKQTCSLASTDGSKAFKGVPWDKLEEE